MPIIPVNFYAAQDIPDNSWLNRPEYAWFKAGHGYASGQTRAIPALSEVSPEALYFAVWAIIRGARMSEFKEQMLEDLELKNG